MYVVALGVLSVYITLTYPIRSDNDYKPRLWKTVTLASAGQTERDEVPSQDTT